MKPQFFTNATKFRSWLEKNAAHHTEVLVGYYKVGTGKPSMNWSESVDQAICFGWIDGVRKSIDEESYCIRFTPRRKDSIWSAVNIKKVEAMRAAGLMTPAGEKSFSYRTESKSQIYAFEQSDVVLSIEFEKVFRKNKSAWTFFEKQAPSYKKQMIHWVMSAKQEKTQLSRLEKIVQASVEEKRLR